MSGMKAKIQHAQYWLKHNLLVFDNIVLLIACTFCLAWTYGSIDSMSRNWSLAEEVQNRERERAMLELEVETYALENEYYKSVEYQELAARKYQNKKLPGESMLYLPASSEAAITKHKATTKTEQETAASQKTNFEEWLAFLFGI